MNRILKIGLFCLFFLVSLSLADIFSQTDNSMNAFLKAYFYNEQKLLFLINLFITSLALVYLKPIFNSFILIRIKETFFNYVLNTGLKFTLISAIYLIPCFTISGFIKGLVFDIGISGITAFVKLLFFIFSWYCFALMFYFVIKKLTPAVIITMFCNFISVAAFYSIEFFVFDNMLSDFVEQLFFEVYISITIVVSLLYLYKNTEVSKCISLRK